MKCCDCNGNVNPKKETYVSIRTVWFDTGGDQLRFVAHDETYHTACYREPSYSRWGGKKLVKRVRQLKKGTRIIKGDPFPEFVMYPIVRPPSSSLWNARPTFLSEAPAAKPSRTQGKAKED